MPEVNTVMSFAAVYKKDVTFLFLQLKSFIFTIFMGCGSSISSPTIEKGDIIGQLKLNSNEADEVRQQYNTYILILSSPR